MGSGYYTEVLLLACLLKGGGGGTLGIFGWGLAVYKNKKLAKGVTDILSENKIIIWCKLDKTYFNFLKNIQLSLPITQTLTSSN